MASRNTWVSILKLKEQIWWQHQTLAFKLHWMGVKGRDNTRFRERIWIQNVVELISRSRLLFSVALRINEWMNEEKWGKIETNKQIYMQISMYIVHCTNVPRYNNNQMHNQQRVCEYLLHNSGSSSEPSLQSGSLSQSHRFRMHRPFLHLNLSGSHGLSIEMSELNIH